MLKSIDYVAMIIGCLVYVFLLPMFLEIFGYPDGLLTVTVLMIVLCFTVIYFRWSINKNKLTNQGLIE